MSEHKVRRLLVIDGHALVAQAAVARALPDPAVGDRCRSCARSGP
ncbi:hypothetical protein [Streptomyces sp. NPDC005148]